MGAMAATIELLVVEVWTNLRPNLAGVSAWTLDGCLMKYDRFKQQLIGEQEEVRDQTGQRSVECLSERRGISARGFVEVFWDVLGVSWRS